MEDIKKEQGIKWICDSYDIRKSSKREFIGFVKEIKFSSVIIKWLSHPYISESKVSIDEILRGKEFVLL